MPVTRKEKICMKRFTRIELVVVLLFIVIVLVILLPPPLQKAKAKSNMPGCHTNLRQLGNAGALYEGDNQGARPGPQPLGISVAEVSWDRLLALQKGAKLGDAWVYEPLANLTQKPEHAEVKHCLVGFSCPLDLRRAGAHLTSPLTPGVHIARSYTLNLGSGNRVAGVDDGIAFAADAIPVSKVESGAGTVNLVDNQVHATVFGQKNRMGDTVMTCSKQGVLDPVDSFITPRVLMHGSKKKPQVNVLMYDGHVEILDQTMITADGGKIMQYIK
jgi:prepilin-type processing-associated H-X9-DG protein